MPEGWRRSASSFTRIRVSFVNTLLKQKSHKPGAIRCLQLSLQSKKTTSAVRGFAPTLSGQVYQPLNNDTSARRVADPAVATNPQGHQHPARVARGQA